MEKYDLGLTSESSLISDFQVKQFMKLDQMVNSSRASPERFCLPFQISDFTKQEVNNAFELVMEGNSVYGKLVEEMRKSGAFISTLRR